MSVPLLCSLKLKLHIEKVLSALDRVAPPKLIKFWPDKPPLYLKRYTLSTVWSIELDSSYSLKYQNISLLIRINTAKIRINGTVTK